MDLLRVLAVFLVVFNHTGDRGYMLFADRMGTPLFFPYMLISILCKVAVPVFFMISGALLLPRQESFKMLFTKRILRMVIVLVVISVPYYVWLHGAKKLDIASFLMHIFQKSASTSLWYLYSYIALLLMMPFLRSMVKTMSEKEFIYLIAGHIVLAGILPCLVHLLWEGKVSFHESFTPVIFVNQNIFYALIGYYFEHVADLQKWGKRVIIPVVLVNVAALGLTAYMTWHQIAITGERSTSLLEQFFNCFICIPTMTIFAALKIACCRIRSRNARNILMILGEAVFGVYLIEKVARSLTNVVYQLLNPVVGSFIASLAWCLAVLCVSFVVVIAVKRIPGLKRIINKFI